MREEQHSHDDRARRPRWTNLDSSGRPRRDFCFAMAKQQSAELVLGRVLVVHSGHAADWDSGARIWVKPAVLLSLPNARSTDARPRRCGRKPAVPERAIRFEQERDDLSAL